MFTKEWIWPRLRYYIMFFMNNFGIDAEFAANTIARYPPILSYTIEELCTEFEFYIRNGATMEYVLYRIRDGML